MLFSYNDKLSWELEKQTVQKHTRLYAYKRN